MLSFDEDTFVFQFAIKKYKDLDILNYNFASLCMGLNLGLTCKEGHILWVFENRVVIKAFEPKAEEVKRE